MRVTSRLRDSLRQRVKRECGPADRLATLRSPHFSDWLQRGDRAPESDQERVVGGLATYLATAERIGRGWGVGLGVAVGLALSIVLALAVLVFGAAR